MELLAEFYLKFYCQAISPCIAVQRVSSCRKTCEPGRSRAEHGGCVCAWMAVCCVHTWQTLFLFKHHQWLKHLCWLEAWRPIMDFTASLFATWNSHQMWPQLLHQQKSACLFYFLRKKLELRALVSRLLCRGSVADPSRV